ncbi:MAG: peptidyl-prolyl cis-trans isomerase [Armatimonadota bacterium]|nr:peptidyl-prolyl cis-trans isomerase [Armatimonadota bacterium]
MLLAQRRFVAAGLILVSALLVAGCGKKPAAKVNGRVIPRERFYEILERATGAQLLINLISEELILEEAEKQKLLPTDADITRRLADVRKANPQAFAGLSEMEARRQVQVSLAIRNLALKGVTVSDAEVKQAFEKFRPQFDQPETVEVRRAVFKTREEAEAAHNTLQKAGVEFTVVLGKNIDHPEFRQNAGNLPPFVRTQDPRNPYVFFLRGQDGQLVPQPADLLLGPGVAQKIFGLPEKGVSEVLPCPSPKGFQVIQVVRHNPAKKGTLEEWKERIREQLMIEKRFQNEKLPEGVDPLNFFRAQLIERLRKNAKIEIGIDRFKDLPQREEAWPHTGGAAR